MIQIQVISGYLVKNGSSFFLIPPNPTNLEVSPLIVTHNFPEIRELLN